MPSRERERLIGMERGVGRRESTIFTPCVCARARFAGALEINLRCAAVDGPAPRPPRMHLGVVGPVSGPLFARGIFLHGRTRANRCKV